MFKKWFGRKKDDDEDFDDEDFDEEDFGDDDFDGEDADEPGEDVSASADDVMSSDTPLEGDAGASEDTSSDQGEGQTTEDLADAGAEPDDLGGEDDYDDDDDDDEDDEDEDEEEAGKFAAVWENKWIRLSVIGLSAVFLLVGIGIGAWWFISGDGEEEIAQQDQQIVSSGGGLQPSSSGSLNSLNTDQGQVPAAGQDLAPPTVSNEDVSGEQLSGVGATSGLGTSSGLNALGAGGGAGGLNTITGEQAATGGGVVIPMTTASSFAQFPDYPTNDALSKAPIPELLQFRDGELPLPKISPDGKVSWQEYARPDNVPVEKRRVALLVSGLGLSRAATLSAISKLPAAVSLSFSPYAEELEQWMIRSRRKGHEVLLGLPLEPDRFPIEDPGPLGLLVNQTELESQRRLDTVLSSQQGYIGVEVLMGSKYTSDEFKVRELLTQLSARGLMIVDGAWNNRSLIPRIAPETAIPYVLSSVKLDDVKAKAAIDAKLKELDSVVELRNRGIGSTTISPAIMERLLAWISSLPGRNIELVPVSAMIKTGPDS